jgi:hypothetical protein
MFLVSLPHRELRELTVGIQKSASITAHGSDRLQFDAFGAIHPTMILMGQAVIYFLFSLFPRFRTTRHVKADLRVVDPSPDSRLRHARQNL